MLPSHVSARHILSVVRNLQGGGVERALLRLAGGWIAAGRRVTIVAGSLEGPLAAELPAGVETIVLGTPSYRALLSRTPGAIGDTAADVFFCPGSYYTGVAAWTRARLGAGAPLIVAKLSNALSRADHHPLVDAGHRAWLALHGRFLDHAVAMTPASAVAVDAAWHMRGHVSVIPNPPAIDIPGAPLPPLPHGRFLLGVGRLASQKRWNLLVGVLPHLTDRSIPLVILGEGERRAALEAQVAALDLSERVFLPGNAADPLPAMARAALLVLASDFEGTPGVLREALSVGTPVVTTRSSPAVDEIVTNPSLGTIVPVGDADALRAAIDERLADPARPAPVPPPGADSAARYLALFDRLVAR